MYTEEQMNKILAQVESEFSSLLNKAEEEASETEETVEDTEESSEVVEEMTEEAESEESEEEVSHEYSDEDIKEVEGLYADMDKSEAEIHYKALKKAISASTVEVEPVKKNEKEETVEEVKEDTESLVKDEKIAALAEENEKLQKSIGDLTRALGQFLGKKTAKRKAVTGLNYQTIAKNEAEESEKESFKSLSKTEITAKLHQVASTPISAQDRQLINDYYCKNGSVESIGHLLK
jgi:arsenate reductase-like glutaredoxin family protein